MENLNVNPNVLSEEDKIFFEENGYVVVNLFKNLEVLNKFEDQIKNTAKIILKNNSLFLYEKYLHHDNISEILIGVKEEFPLFINKLQRAIIRSPEYFQLATHNLIIAAFRDMFGKDKESPIYMLSNGVIFTYPNDDRKVASNIKLDWHTDLFYTIPRSRFMHVWMPLFQANNKNNGSLVVCKGSHKSKVHQHIINPDDSYNYRYIVDKKEVSKYEEVHIEVQRGEFLLFHSNLIHRSGDNSSGNVRITLIGLYHDVDNLNFEPVSTIYKYNKETPEAYFAETFQSAEAKKLSKQFAAKEEPEGGV